MSSELLVEQKLDLGFVIPGCYGTGDVIILDFDNKEIISIDLKWGKGVKVKAYQNPQPAAYALAAYRTYGLLADFETVRMVIVQPRIEGGISEEVIRIDELEQFEVDLRAAWEAALVDDAPRTPGEEQCKFCRGAGECEALGAEVLEMFDDYPEPDAMDSSDLAAVLPRLPLIETWAAQVRNRARTVLEEGGSIPGYKLVAGRRGNRKWADESAVIELMKKTWRMRDDQIFSKSLISPAQVEKQLTPARWGKLQDLITQSEGAPALVPESDKRPALQPADTDDFDDL